MTNAERWDTTTSPTELCRLLASGSNVSRTKAGRRKLRLVGCGCCRLLWSMFTRQRLRAAVETAEQWADGIATKDDAEAASQRVWWGSWLWSQTERRIATTARALLVSTPIWRATRAAEMLLVPALDQHRPCSLAEARVQYVGVYRCVFGNPYRPVPFDPRWRTGTATGLAQAIDSTREFDRLPILADALEEAGCDDLDLLTHARGNGPHHRGCRVLDAALDRG